MQIIIDEEAVGKLQDLVKFMSMGVKGANFNSVTEVAISEMYRDFEKISRFQAFIEEERTAVTAHSSVE